MCESGTTEGESTRFLRGAGGGRVPRPDLPVAYVRRWRAPSGIGRRALSRGPDGTRPAGRCRGWLLQPRRGGGPPMLMRVFSRPFAFDLPLPSTGR